ncbi:MAG: DUF2442 domain-containing protein [Acidimicrobiia bacterium]|nr:DUF2442 domain-containing protein [bacterium]MXX00641.1 DUF2442 domain-containing protein [Acidimicrobiia bacterium]MXY73371.1 DUF2442 domain-containing protein [Acidimicrobiia bacterium]MYG92709.1 DUF2442 domain-containing protein [Acidimicrobiia bacterium]
MTSLISKRPVVVGIEREGELLTFSLEDRRHVTMPLSWYPRLCDATDKELSNWRLLGGGEGVNWPDLDEDINVQDVINGLPSAESARSLGRWLLARRNNRQVTLGAIRRHEESVKRHRRVD